MADQQMTEEPKKKDSSHTVKVMAIPIAVVVAIILISALCSYLMRSDGTSASSVKT